MPKKRPRKLGDRVLYTPNQTQRYQSQWTRYQKGLALAESRNILRVEENVYRVPSDRSPIGYWQIEAAAAGGDFIIQSYGIGGGNTSGLQSTQLLREYDPADFTYAELQSLLGADGTAIDEFINGEGGIFVGAIYDYTNRITRNSDRSQIIAYHSRTTDEEILFDATHLVTFEIIAPLDYPTPSEVNFEVVLIPTEPNPDNFLLVIPSNPVVLTFPTIYSDFKLQTIEFQFINLENLIISGFFETGLSVTLLDAPSSGGGYTCTCPDFSKVEGAFIPPPYDSMSQPRDWTASAAGAPTWADGQRRCYHIVGVQQVRDENIPVPTDFPLGEA